MTCSEQLGITVTGITVLDCTGLQFRITPIGPRFARTGRAQSAYYGLILRPKENMRAFILRTISGCAHHGGTHASSRRSKRRGGTVSTDRDTLSLEQFLAADHIVVNQQGRSQEIFEKRVRELKLQRRVVLHLPHFMSVPQLVATSDMISTVPFSLGAWYADAGLKLLPPPVSIPLIELRQHWHRRMNNEPAVRWLQSIVAEELRDRDPALAMSADYAKSRAKAAGPSPSVNRSSAQEPSLRGTAAAIPGNVPTRKPARK
jgi:hypothetical protein